MVIRTPVQYERPRKPLTFTGWGLRSRIGAQVRHRGAGVRYGVGHVQPGIEAAAQLGHDQGTSPRP